MKYSMINSVLLMMEMPHKEQLKQFLNKGGLPLIFIRRFKMLRLIKNILGKTIKFIYRMTYKLIPTHKKTVLFIAFHGRGYSDNPRAIYEYMRQQDQFKDYRFIWAITSYKKKNITIENAKVIEYFSIPLFLLSCKKSILDCKL